MSVQRSLWLSVSLIALSLPAFAGDAAAPAPAAPVVPAAPASATSLAPAVPAAAPAAIAAPAPAAPAAAPAGFVTKQEIPALVREAIMNDPEMVMEAVKKLKEKQMAESKKKAAEAMTKNKQELFGNPDSPSIGDVKTADVTLVEYFDYHCGYCRHLLPDLTKLYKEDGKLRIIFKEFPILGDDSVNASRAAIAVNRIAKDKYFDFHTALMKHEGKYDEKSILEIAKKVGVPGDKLKAEMGKPEVTAVLDKNRAVAEEIGIRGTPAIIIGDELTPGAMPYEDLKKAVEAARGGKPADAAAPAPAAPAAAAPAAKPTAAPAIAAPSAAAPAAPAAPVPPAPPKQ